MIPGLGLIRRSITIVLCGAAFWAGVKFAQTGQAQACLAAGGTYDARGFCSNEAPLK
jgi:hypothetical protein